MARINIAEKNNCSCQYEMAFRTAIWVFQRKKIPMAEELIDRYGCSRSTAHRWFTAWCDATGTNKSELFKNRKKLK